MQKQEAPKTITVDGKEHPVESFSEVIQRLVSIHTAWRNELADERLAVAKTEAALRALDAELTERVGKELAAKVAPAPAASSIADAVAAAVDGAANS